MNTEIKTCEDCEEEVVMSFNSKGEFVRYKKMCPCLVEIMRLRRIGLKRRDDFMEARRKGAK